MNLPQTVLAAMRQTNELFDAEVVRKRNVDALDRVYTANARVLPPGAPMIAGRDAIKSFWRAALDSMDIKQSQLATVDAEAAGDSVIEIGRADLTVAGGQVVTVKYVVQWKQEDGAWKWNIDIWNPNA